MNENHARAVGAALSAIMAAAIIGAVWKMLAIMAEVRDDQRKFQAALLDQYDHAKWAAEVDQAREAPGEG